MYDNLDKDLDVNTLADVATMSPYHFHRIYREMARETVNATVRRLRLQRAAAELIASDQSISGIAKSLCYGSIEAFSRAFTKQFAMSPREYRASKKNTVLRNEPFVAMLPLEKKVYTDTYTVDVAPLPAINIAGYDYQGDFMGIIKVFEKLSIDAASQGLMNDDTRLIGLYYDDPESVEEAKLSSMACITVPEHISLSGIDAKSVTIPEGKYATLLYKGPYAELEKPYDYLFGEWLPNSGYELGHFPPIEEYLNSPKDVPPNELLTVIRCLLVS